MLRFLLLLAFSAIACSAADQSTRQELESLLSAKKFAEAQSLLEKMISAEPQNAEAHARLGVVAQILGESDYSIQEMEKATALEPTNSTYMLELGGAYGFAAQKAGLLSKLGLARKARAALEKAVELDPNNIAARNGLISYYREAPSFAGGGMEKAYAQAEEIRKRDPIIGAAVLGQLYLADNKTEQAFAVYSEALKAAPENYALLYGIGRAAAQTGQHLQQGEQSLRQCLHLQPQSGDPGYQAVHWRLGNVIEKQGNLAGARAEYEEALKIDPHFKYASESLAALNGKS